MPSWISVGQELAKDDTVEVIGSRFRQVLFIEPLTDPQDEIRMDPETQSSDGNRYHGLAPDGTATSTAEWDVVQFTLTSGEVTRIRYNDQIAWDDRTTSFP